jgi:hypothetical protein
MRSGPRGSRRSVNRGAHRPAIEPRKFPILGADAVHFAEGNTSRARHRERDQRPPHAVKIREYQMSGSERTRIFGHVPVGARPMVDIRSRRARRARRAVFSARITFGRGAARIGCAVPRSARLIVPGSWMNSRAPTASMHGMSSANFGRRNIPTFAISKASSFSGNR